MVTVQGKGVFGGIAIGKLAFYKKNDPTVKRRRVQDIAAELQRFEEAKTGAIAELKLLYEKALKEVGEANAQIFEIHQMMIEDLDYNDSIRNMIETQNVNAEYAVSMTADNFSMMFAAMEDEYMRERAADVADVSNRIIKFLTNHSSSGPSLSEKCIICADDLAPSETVQLDKENVLAFVTVHGSLNSHTAILARTMNIPAIVSAGDFMKEEYDGADAIVDGSTGTLYIHPDAGTLTMMQKKREEFLQKKQLLQTLKGKENVTPDGQKINIYANIGGLSDVGAVLLNDAGGIGLFRSEFLYLESSDFPTEEVQFNTYRKVLENMAGKKVIIRTLDIGADKQIGYFNLDKEENPALGYRAIRICLTRKEIFKTQLRALYRASAYGTLAIMFPMIISKSEVLEIKRITEEVKAELREQHVPFSEDVELGIMIETPASVMVSDQLAPEVDFFSVGTNDLTQYTLAIDRQNPKLDSFYDPHHPAVLRMIKMAADNAHKYGKWIGICGELGGDTALTELFLAMGIDELSVSPGLVLPLRDAVRKANVAGQKDTLFQKFGLV